MVYLLFISTYVMSLFDQSCDSIPAWPFPRDFPLASCFAPRAEFSLQLHSRIILRSRWFSAPVTSRGPSHPTPAFATVREPVLRSCKRPYAVESINIIVLFFFGPAELRCYHRAVAKLTPEFPGTGTSQFRPRCHSCTPHFSLRSALHALPRPSLRLSYPSHFRRFKAHTSLAT